MALWQATRPIPQWRMHAIFWPIAFLFAAGPLAWAWNQITG